jgi:outer membrane protein Pom
MRLALLALALALAIPAWAQDAELGVRYWFSSGKSTRSHNAQSLDPTLGNPTSVLTYTNLDAQALELYGRKDFAGDWFVKGNAGVGTITGGSLRDEDFNVGQRTDTDTTSTVKGNNLGYATLDFGYTLGRTSNGSAGLFIGYQYWRERLDAYGVVFTFPPFGATAPDSVPAITNEVTWQSLRLGFTSTASLGPRSRLSADVAFVPYAKVRDEDSHWLRQNPSAGPFFLGPAPNIHMEGTGYGFQFELELRHALQSGWELGGGLRYWWLQAKDGTRKALGTSVPIVEIESQRGGIMLSLTRRW